MARSGATQWPRLDNTLLSSDEEEYDRVASDLAQQLSKTPDLESHVLDELDPAQQTLPFLHILSAQIDASTKSGKAPGRQLPSSVLPEGRLWNSISALLITFDPIQVRYAGHTFSRIVEVVARGAEQTKDYVPAIQLLESVILRLDPTASTLTTTHHYYIRLSLLATAYLDATVILDRPLYAIPSQEIAKQVGNRGFKYLCSAHESSSTYLTPSIGLTQKITSRIYLEYFSMGAMCYLAVGQYTQALLFLEVVLTTPTVQNAVSVIQSEAYKKWLLLNLLVHGKSGKVPTSISQPALRSLRAVAKPYECVVEAFGTNKIERLRGEIQEGIQLWQEDDNYGLMHEVFAAFRKFSVIRLGKVYAAIPVQEVARLTSPNPDDLQETVAYISTLIETEELQAQLILSGNGNGILRFATQQEKTVPEAQVEQQLVIRTQELQRLLKNVSDLDHQLEIHKEYVEFLQKLKNARDREKKSNTLANRPVAPDMHDEDMMDDM